MCHGLENRRGRKCRLVDEQIKYKFCNREKHLTCSGSKQFDNPYINWAVNISETNEEVGTGEEAW